MNILAMYVFIYVLLQAFSNGFIKVSRLALDRQFQGIT
jgi:hypothetical protein